MGRAELAEYRTVLREDGLEVPQEGPTVERGMFHDVVVVPDRFVARFPRTHRALTLAPHRVELLRAAGVADLPLEIPAIEDERLDRPLGSAYMLMTWVPGRPSKGAAPPASDAVTKLGAVIEALHAADVDMPDPGDAQFGGGQEMSFALERSVYPKLSAEARAEAERRLAAVRALPPVAPRLIHGDLCGDNLRWDPASGELVGIIDWDLARYDDPAIDVACVADEFGWEVCDGVFDPASLERARAWSGVFGLEAAAEAALLGEEGLLEGVVKAVAQGLQ